VNDTLPSQIKKYFWGDNLEELTWSKHQKYIIQTLLDKGDEKALKWLFTKVTRDEIQKMLPSLKLQSKSANFWQIYFS
jgi:hypothetical protein